jgi:hypothetical protein
LSEEKKVIGLGDVVSITYLTRDNCTFTKNGDFLSLTVSLPKEIGLDGEEIGGIKTYDRVFFHRAFPYDYPYEFISVLDRENVEIGIIRELSDIEPDAAELVKSELDRKYYAPVIDRIVSVKERFGYTYWHVISGGHELTFTVRDVYRSITKVTQTRIFISDEDGNRYEIPDTEALDRKSYRKIELYL